jgi:hypothetical protein
MDLSKIKTSELLAELQKRKAILGNPFSELDVDNLARDLGYFPDEQDIDLICENINRHFDAEQGVNWETIENAIKHHFFDFN